jgi:tRNA-modifying protein YgfZ
MTETDAQAPGPHVGAPQLADRSEHGKLALTGEEAKAFLDGQLSNKIVDLRPGQGLEGALLTPKGRMLAIVRVLDLGDELLLLTDRPALQVLFDRLRAGLIGWRAELHKRTLQLGLLALEGPGARELAGAPGELHATAEGPFGLAVATAAGAEVLPLAGRTAEVREALLAAGATPADPAALEVARIERGEPAWGVDLEPEGVIPQEAGLNDRLVSFTKACYVGQETVARLRWKGKPNRHLRGLRLTAPVPAGTPLRLGEREVGVLTSVADSPAHGPIGLALLRREAEPGATLDAGGAEAVVTALPFAPTPQPAPAS